MRRVALRVLPLLMVCYFVASLDRVNIGFAALTMNKKWRKKSAWRPHAAAAYGVAACGLIGTALTVDPG
jgi:hypothetical protein